MVLLRRCAAGLLCAAGTLSLVSSTRAEPPRVARPIHLVGSPRASPGQVKLEAMKVEMAWLADRTTYGMPLEVHVHGEALRACGRVSDEAARQQVLEVGRQASCLPVADGLSVANPEPALLADPRTLEGGARAALRQHLGEMAAELQVHATAQGLVTLHGEVTTVEDKLTASRGLKGLRGCAAVVNDLRVMPVRHDGHTVTVVTRDGQHAVHGAMPFTTGAKPAISQPLDGEEITRGLPRPSQAVPAPYILPPAPVSTLPSGLPAQRVRVQVIRGGSPTGETRTIRYISPSGNTAISQGYPDAAAKSEGMPGQVVQHSSRPSLWERLMSFTKSKRESEVAASGAVVPPAKATTEPPVVSVTAKDLVWPKASATTLAAGPVPAEPPQPVSRPLAHLVRVSGKPAVKAEPPKATVAEPKPAEPMMQPVVQVAATPGPRSPEEVMRVVRGHCGKFARDVRVEVYKDGSTVVKVFAPAANEGPLVARLLGLPALGEKVKVQVVLGR